MRFIASQEALSLLLIATGLALLLAIWTEPWRAALAGTLPVAVLYAVGCVVAPRGIEDESPRSGTVLGLMVGLVLVPLALYPLTLAGIAGWPGLALAVIGLILLGLIAPKLGPLNTSWGAAEATDAHARGLDDLVRHWWITPLALCALLVLAVVVTGPLSSGSAFIVFMTAALSGLVGAWRSWPSPDEAARRASRSDHAWNYQPWVLLAALAIIVGVRLLPFLESASPLGFDTGIYRGLQREFATALPAFPDFAAGSIGETEPVGLYLVTNLLHLFGWNADGSVFAFLIVGQLLLAGGIWFVIRDVGGPLSAVLAVLLFALSATQFDSFWYVYHKQLLATALLLYLIWTWRRDSLLSIPLGMLLAGTHHLTFLLAGLMLATDFAVRHLRSGSSRRQCARELGMGGAILLGGLALYIPAPEALLQPVREIAGSSIVGAPGAFFGPLTVERFVERGIFIIPLAIVATGLFRHDRSVQLLTYAAAWVLVMAGLEFMAYRRFLLLLDVIVICLASLTLIAVATRVTAAEQSLVPRGVVAVATAFVLSSAFLWSTYTLGVTVSERDPLIPSDEFAAITAVDAATPRDGLVVTTSSLHAPWLYGYSDRTVIAENLFGPDRWTPEEWQVVLSSPDPALRARLIARYPDPVYLFLPQPQSTPTPRLYDDRALIPVSPFLWRYGADP